MLVLTRRVGEAVIIKDSLTGERIRVVICDPRVSEGRGSNGKQTRLGFQSSSRFQMVREELLEDNAKHRQTDTDRPACPTHIPEGYDDLETV